ncbi:MAG TPA: patatin-like phospholipase family protein [Clostridia bacterium]|jgi:NTE family protein|nr:patatin-like phospholipase family protein [Clostridia bacterium]
MKKKVGLALGAGSAKGFAHIGVLQALEESGIAVDMIAGSSMGAIIGGIYSVGTDLAMLQRFITSIKLYDYLDVKLPLNGGLLKGERLQDLIRVLTHNKTFAETKIPFCCVVVDAETGKLDVLEEGPLHESIRASMSMPAFFEPVPLNGKIYIDGGVLERVPCKTLRDHGMDVVIGVDVGYHGDLKDVSDFGAYSMLNHTISIMQWELTKYRREEADIMLVPEVLFVNGRFQTDQAGATIEEGRRSTLEAIPAIRKLLEA